MPAISAKLAEVANFSRFLEMQPKKVQMTGRLEMEKKSISCLAKLGRFAFMEIVFSSFSRVTVNLFMGRDSRG